MSNLFERIMHAAGAHTGARILSSWAFQSPDERKLRRKAIITMANELALIRRIDTFSSLLGEAAIEAIIEGDWVMVRTWAQHFTFAEEPEERLRDRYRVLWKTFVALLEQAAAEHEALVVKEAAEMKGAPST